MTFCTNCGTKLNPGSTRCDACGTAIIAVKPTPPEAPRSGVQPISDNLKTQASNPKTGEGQFSTAAGVPSPQQAIGAQVGRVLGGRYQLSQVIGSGGMGEIYRARRLHIGDTVAVKVLRPDVVENEKSRQRFYREARAAAMLHHPNAVVIHDFGEDTDGTAYIVMELLVGRSLRQVLIDEGSVNALRCYGIIRQTCAALDAGHRNGIIHRDIKPDNIVLLDSNDGVDHVKILDFGIAKLRDQALDTLSIEQRLTNVGTVIGTPHYMAPEQCQGEEADARSDIYSLGVVLYELLTGVAPFLAKTPTGVAIKHVTERPRPLRELQPNITDNVERVVLRALEKDPNARQQTALELAREYDSAIRSDGITESFIRSGEQARVDQAQIEPETLIYADSQKTELLSKSQKTEANRVVESQKSFETSITPPLPTDQFKEPATGQISAANKTSEQKIASDALRTQVTPSKEALGSSPRNDSLSGPAEKLPGDLQQERTSKTGAVPDSPQPPPPSVIDPLRTDPMIRAEGATKQPMQPERIEAKAEIRPRVAKVEREEQKAQIGKQGRKIDIPLPPAIPVLSPTRKPVPVKSRTPLYAGLGALVLILGGLTAWMMSGGGGAPSQPAVATDSPAVAASVAPSPTATSAFPEVTAPEGMVYVLGGAFRVGRDDGEENEKPSHTVTVKPYFIDRTEVTNEQYQNFVDTTGRAAPPIWKGNHFPDGADKLPVTDVSWDDAKAYAEWAGKRLPTEEEWEFAARGDQGRLFPWGDRWQPDTSNTMASEGENRNLMPVGQFIQGASPFGVLDLIGNAWEWTDSDYREYPGGKVEPLPAGFSNMKVIRGGCYQSAAKKTTATLRYGWPGSRNDWPAGQAPDYAQTGFRCVQDVKTQ